MVTSHVCETIHFGIPNLKEVVSICGVFILFLYQHTPTISGKFQQYLSFEESGFFHVIWYIIETIEFFNTNSKYIQENNLQLFAVSFL